MFNINVPIYYCGHSTCTSFQCQLSYFEFKKCLHSGKKGKFSTCLCINGLMTKEMSSLIHRLKSPPLSWKCAVVDSTAAKTRQQARKILRRLTGPIQRPCHRRKI